MSVRSRIETVIAAGVTEPPAPRPARLRRGRLDLVFAADTVTALILFLVTNNVLTNSQHSGAHNAGLIALDSFVLCAPLVLRTRYPLTAWTMSTLAMLFASWTATAFSVLPDKYAIPGIIVYLLCLYAVAVRCRAWVVVTASAVTVIGSIIVQSRTLLTAIFLGAIVVGAGVIVRYRRGSREQLAVV